MAFCLALPERAGVVAIPTQPFYDDPDAGRQLIRWAFCKQASVIEEALEPAGRGGPGLPVGRSRRLRGPRARGLSTSGARRTSRRHRP